MQSLQEFLAESDQPTNSTAGVSNSDPKPIGKSTFMGHTCVDVDDETYATCVTGKVPFRRWTNYVSDETLRSELKKQYAKNKRLLVRNSTTGAMSFVK